MKREQRRYSGYRGRTTTTDKLRVIAMILLVLVVLAVGILIYGQRYIVYTDDGLRVDVPFLQKDEPAQPKEELDNVKVVVEPAEPKEITPTPEPVEEAEEAWIKAVSLPLESVAQGTALQQAQELGANAVVLDMKDDWGKLGYISGQALAAEITVNSQNEEINETLKELAQTELCLVARISCFRDHALADSQEFAIETNPGRRWYDLDGVRWSSPANQNVQNYLIEIMTELAELGFDEILLENWGYPTQKDGHLEYIKKGEHYKPGELDGVIGAFLQRAQDALKRYDVRLSVKAASAVLEGNDPESGQTLEQLVQLNGRVWLDEATDPAKAKKRLEENGVKDVSSHLVENAVDLDADMENNQLLLTEES